MEPKRFLDIYIAGLWLSTTWKHYLFSRQLKVLRKNPGVPQVLEAHVPNEVYQSKRSRMSRHLRFGIVTSWIGLAIKTIGLRRASLANTWAFTAAYSSDVGQRVLFYCIFEVISVKTPVILFSIAGFLLSLIDASGDSNVSLGKLIFTLFYVAVLCVSTVLSTAILVYLTDSYGVNIFFYLLLPIMAVTFVSTVLFVKIVAPTVYEPLPEGDVRDRVLSVARAAQFSQTRIYCLPNDSAVETEGHPNAYFMGTLGVNMILVSQGLLDTMRAEEVAAVVAHEMGHWNFYHTTISYALAVAETIAFSMAMRWSYGNSWFLEAFGFDVVGDNPHPAIGMYIMASQVYYLVRTVWRGISNSINISCEYVADDYSYSLGQGPGLRRALLNIAEHTSGFPLYDHLFAAWFFGHPTLLRRIERIDNREGNAQGRQ